MVRTFKSLAKCDKQTAEDSFIATFLPRAKDLDTFVALSETAITSDIWVPTWKMLGNIKDYSTRNELTAAIGEKCLENPKVVPFLQASYLGLKNLEFQRWSDAFQYCESEDLAAWIKSTVEKPPKNPLMKNMTP